MTKKVEKPLEEASKNVETSLGVESDKIWSEIKDRPIEMFALPNQKVSDHCFPINIEPSKLYLKTRSTSVLPSLEASCGSNFVVELVDKYVTVTRSTVPLTQK